MNDTTEPVHKSNGADPVAKLSRMLRSMSRRFPRTFLLTTWEGFGVRLDDGRYLHIVRSGKWTPEDMRDFLALFATWLVADPDRVLGGEQPLAGVSATVLEQSRQ